MAINELCCAASVKWDVVQLPLVVYLWGLEKDIKLKPQSRNICLFISPWVTIYRGSFCSIFLMNLKQRIDAEYIFCRFIKNFMFQLYVKKAVDLYFMFSNVLVVFVLQQICFVSDIICNLLTKLWLVLLDCTRLESWVRLEMNF